MTPGQCYLIALGTLFLVVFSWKFSIRAKRYHGIARFFAFESLLVMITLNSGPWFQANCQYLQSTSLGCFPVRSQP